MAEKQAHTPGPWEYQDGSPQSYGSAWVNSPDVKRIAICDGVRRSETHGFCLRMNDGENEANARLIASAPAMLEALTRALPYVETAEADEAYKPGEVAKVTAMIRAAIRQAEGGE